MPRYSYGPWDIETEHPTHWGLYFSTLSLKAGRVFWPDMGLRIPPSAGDSLQQLAATAFDRFLAHADYLSDVSRAHAIDILAGHLDAVSAQTSAHDETTSSEIVHWSLRSFLGGRSKDYEWLWRGVLFALHHEIQGSGNPPISIPDHSEELARVVSDFVSDIRTTKDAIRSAAEGLLEDGDRQILARTIPTGDEADGDTPFDAIADTCMVSRFRQLWRDLTRAGDYELMVFLNRRYVAFLTAKGLDRTRPDLLHPPNIDAW